MADRRGADLAACRLVAGAKRAAAEMAHARAVATEATAIRREEGAAQDRDAAATAWRDHLAGAFDPALGTLLGGSLIAAAGEADAAAADRRATGEARAAEARRWREDDARCIQSRSLIAAHVRRTAMARDARQLAGLADRITFTWSRR